MWLRYTPIYSRLCWVAYKREIQTKSNGTTIDKISTTAYLVGNIADSVGTTTAKVTTFDLVNIVD